MGETVRSLMKTREIQALAHKHSHNSDYSHRGMTKDDVVDGEMMTNGDDIQILLHSLRIL